ncbi:MAG: DUF1015 domain-containing protein [Candidatus Binatia bacterium]
MAIIRPFCGTRYNPAVAGDISQLVSPPYDVISPEQQTELHLRSRYNAIHLDLNQEVDRYEAAARRFQQWLHENVLRQDEEPALYFYTQEFALHDGVTRKRTGVFAALRLEEFSTRVVRPHERTFERAKQDRLALLRACQTHLSPVFCLYARRNWSLQTVAHAVFATPALAEIVDDHEIHHSLWRTTDQAVIAAVVEGLARETLIIADGHHRYETALRYRQERAAQGRTTGTEAYNYVLAYLTNAYDEGVVILPTHRLLRDVRVPQAYNLRLALQRDFRVKLFSRNDVTAFLTAFHRAPASERHIGCAMAGAEHYWLLSFNEQHVTQNLSLPSALRALDVTALHDVILQRFVGLPAALQKQSLSYTIDEREALRLVDARRVQGAFLLNPTTYEQVAAVCEQGETMPQKSTYFFPKLLTGLVFYQLS